MERIKVIVVSLNSSSNKELTEQAKCILNDKPPYYIPKIDFVEPYKNRKERRKLKG